MQDDLPQLIRRAFNRLRSTDRLFVRPTQLIHNFATEINEMRGDDMARHFNYKNMAREAKRFPRWLQPTLSSSSNNSTTTGL